MKLESQKLEALLLLAEEPLTRKELRRRLEIDENGLQGCIQELQESLHGHGITLVIAGDEVGLSTSAALAEWIQTFLPKSEYVLSKAASETLAIVMYCGPIARSDIEAIRGVDCRSMLRLLLQRGLVIRQESGQPGAAYDISAETLRGLGVSRKEDLPDYPELAHHAILKHLIHKPV